MNIYELHTNMILAKLEFEQAIQDPESQSELPRLDQRYNNLKNKFDRQFKNHMLSVLMEDRNNISNLLIKIPSDDLEKGFKRRVFQFRLDALNKQIKELHEQIMSDSGQV